MDRVFIENYTLIAKHGYYKEEHYKPQRFVVSVYAEDMNGKTKAILFGGSGQGEAIVANRFPGVRAVVWYGDGENNDQSIIKLSRQHNDANVLSIGARFVTYENAKQAIDDWLSTPFSNEEKHARRNELIDSIE